MAKQSTGPGSPETTVEVQEAMTTSPTAAVLRPTSAASAHMHRRTLEQMMIQTGTFAEQAELEKKKGHQQSTQTIGFGRQPMSVCFLLLEPVW